MTKASMVGLKGRPRGDGWRLPGPSGSMPGLGLGFAVEENVDAGVVAAGMAPRTPSVTAVPDGKG